MNEQLELDKWANVHEDAVTINQWMDFLSHKGLTLCTVDEKTETFLPTMEMRDNLVAEHFDIDLNKLEEERRKLLDEIRKDM